MKTLITFLVLILSVFSSYSQCVRNISTNPNNPYNDEWESWYPTGSYAGSFVNTGFSWYPNSSILIPLSQAWSTPFQDPNGGDLTMEWPYATDNGQHTSYLYRRIDPETLGDEYPRGEDIPIELRDYHWEDGWELLYLNTGRLPNGERIDQKPGNSWNVSVENPSPVEAPYVVLYNRYRGTLRVFFNVWFEDNTSLDDVTVQLRFTENSADDYTLSGVLRHANGIDQALDQKTIVDNIKTPRRSYIINHDQWYAADFQLGYDACQCRVSSKFVLSFQARNIVTANLVTRSISLTQNIIDDANNLDKTFFQTMVNPDGTYAVPGNQIFKSFDDLTAGYNNALQKYNDYKAPDNQIKIAIATLGNAAILGGIAKVALPVAGVKILLNQTKLDVFGNQVLGPKDDAEAEEWAGKLQAGLKKVLGTEFDFFSAALDIAPEASAPQVPVATFTEGSIQGTLEDLTERYSVPLFVPGTKHDKNGISSHNYPIYNNVLGLFAMLKTPSVKMYAKETLEDDYINPDGDPSRKIGTHIQNNKLTFQLNKLEYAINPALDFDLEKTTFNGAMIISFKSVEKYDPDLESFREFPIGFSNFKINHRMIDDDGYLITEYVSEFYALKSITNQLFQLDASFMGDYEWQHVYGPAGLYEGVPQNQVKQNLHSVKFRVMADMYFDQLGSNNSQVNNFQLFTYELYNREKDNGNLSAAITSNGGTVKTDLTSWVNHHGNIILTGLVTPTSPEIWEVIGSTIYIKAENVLIQNLVGPSEGYNLVIIASRSIDMEPDAQVALNTELISNTFYDNAISNLVPINEDYYDDICESDKYQANIPANTKRAYGSNNTLLEEKSMQELVRLNISPVPVSNELNVRVTEGSLTSCSVKIISITGQTVIQERVSSDLLNGFAIGVEHLVNGYYILELYSDDGFRTQKKFIVQH